MRRPDFLTSTVGTSYFLSRPAGAQTRRARLGWLSGGVRVRANDMAESLIETLKRNLSDLGWRTGDTLDVDERQAGGDASLLPHLSTEIVAQRPKVIACTGGTEAKALQSATREIPIVFLQVAVDPVAVGLVESISRPGGNVTGIMQAPQLLSSKRLSIVTELLGRPPRRAELSAGLPRLKADLILAWGTPAVTAARRATSTLPIIMISVADPVGSGSSPAWRG